jgi:hypothetical protein
MFDVEKFVSGLHDYIGKALSPLATRIKALEERQPEVGAKGEDGAPGSDGKDGLNGKDADPELIRTEVQKAVDAIPKPKDGVDGINGKDGASVSVEDVAALVKSAVVELPAPAPGKDGKDGEQGSQGEPGEKGLDGADGKDGRDGIDGKSAYELAVEHGFDGSQKEWLKSIHGEDGANGRDGIDGKDADPDLIRAEVKNAVEAIPKPQDGRDGRDGVDGKSFTVEEVESILENHFAKWELNFERRATDLLQKAIDRVPAPKDGKDGANGRDALDLDDIELTQADDGRTVTLAFRRGDVVREKSFTLDVVLDRGTFRKGDTYQKGDGVTYAGSYWIAQKKTADSPPSDNWRLAVRRGKDGKDLAQ